jgi:hypothetical protein
MDHFIDLSRGLMGLVMGFDPATRNAVLLCACVVLYGIFIHRGERQGGRRGGRPLRCADSVLRGC